MSVFDDLPTTIRNELISTLSNRVENEAKQYHLATKEFLTAVSESVRAEALLAKGRIDAYLRLLGDLDKETAKTLKQQVRVD